MVRPLFKSSKAFFGYTWGCVTWGALLMFWAVPRLSQEEAWGIVFFTVLALIAEAMPIPLPRGGGTVSVSFVLIYCALLLYGPEGAAVVAAFGTLSFSELRGRVPLRAMLFNRAQLAISATASGFVFMALGGKPGAVHIPGDLLALLLAGTAYGIVNMSVTVFYLAFWKRVFPWSMWLANFRWLTPMYFIFMPIGVLIALVYLDSGWPGVLLFFFPLLVARYSLQRYLDMREVYRSTIRALTAALDAKDPHTYGHSERVARWAVAIGRKLNLPDEQLDLLEYVGMLHDIGKIGIDDAILNKPGVFTAEEYDSMKRHPVIGAEIIQGIHMLGRGAEWVRHHHERYDGTGFPYGLAGEEIPLGARIIAVADAFDAMTSERPYRKSFGLEESRRELKTWAGRQFDSRVVDVMLDLIREPGTLEAVLRPSPVGEGNPG